MYHFYNNFLFDVALFFFEFDCKVLWDILWEAVDKSFNIYK